IALTVLGVIIGHLLSARSQNQATKVQKEANDKTNEQAMIDQLQEEVTRNQTELVHYRQAADARVLIMENRMTAMEERNIEVTAERDKLRNYAHDLRGDIFDRKAPPPRDWPVGVL